MGLPSIQLKSKSLFSKQIFRTLNNENRGSGHYDFWLGRKLGFPQFDSEFFHISGTEGREKDSTPQLFVTALEYVKELLDGNYLTQAEMTDVSTKEIYNLF